MNLIPSEINLNAGGETEVKLSVENQTVLSISVAVVFVAAVFFMLKKI